MDELGTKKVALAESLSPNALLPWVSWFHVSLKTVNQEGKGTCRQGFTSPGFWNKYSVTSTILYWSKQSTRPANIQTGRGIDSVSCWKMRHVTCRGAWMQRGVIHWRSFYNLLQTHKIFCVKKKIIKKDKGEFFKGHDALEKFDLKFFASLCLSLHKSALRKDQVRKTARRQLPASQEESLYQKLSSCS